eukprot:1048057-Rhodomonas_salina.1
MRAVSKKAGRSSVCCGIGLNPAAHEREHVECAWRARSARETSCGELFYCKADFLFLEHLLHVGVHNTCALPTSNQ